MSLAMKGQIVDGLGAAGRLLGFQKPFIVKFFAQIDGCRIGTINVQLEHALDVRIPDIVTPPIAWQTNSTAGERFGFTKVELEFLQKRHSAWIYTAEFSAHRFNYMLVELLAAPIEGIASGLACTLHIDRFTGYVVI